MDYDELVKRLRAAAATSEVDPDEAADAVVQLQQDLAAARALLLKRNPPTGSRPCHECGAIWWSDKHGCWFVGGHRDRDYALAGKDAP
jgi:hypothetical protein